MFSLDCVYLTVINVTLPDEKQNYVHRIGRVGRAERYVCVQSSCHVFWCCYCFESWQYLLKHFPLSLLPWYFRMGLAISLVAKEKEKVIILQSKTEQMLFTEILSTADIWPACSCLIDKEFRWHEKRIQRSVINRNACTKPFHKV